MTNPPFDMSALLPAFDAPGWLASEIAYRAVLGGDAYAAVDGLNGLGTQAHVDILAVGSDDQGLRLTIAAGAEALGETYDGTKGNGIDFFVQSGNNISTRLGSIATQNRIFFSRPLGTTLAQIKAYYDTGGTAGSDFFDAEYFGGETGASESQIFGMPGDAATEGGVEGVWSWYRITAGDDMLAYQGLAAPANDNGSRFISAQMPVVTGYLHPKNQLFFKRAGATDVPGSIELWLL